MGETLSIREQILSKFEETYGAGGEVRLYFSPGRVNLIGEHTDYNGGHVFPCALTMGTYFAVRRREDRTVRLASVNVPWAGVTEVSEIPERKVDTFGWANYPLGVFRTLMNRGVAVTGGYDVLLWGDLPNGSGLSSSASVEVGTAVFLRDFEGFSMSAEEIARVCQESENRFNGVNCGIMDQYAVAVGRQDHAMFLNTETLDCTQVPLTLGDCALVIASTNKKRRLGESKYNERRAQCEEALRRIRTERDVPSLGALSLAQLKEEQERILDPVLFRRARHAVTENERTVEAVSVLGRGDLEGFGRLMTASHMSLKNDYEVTGKELDALVEAALTEPGVLGSRMTGAGFGGCTVSLVKKDRLEAFVENAGQRYLEAVGYAADFYTAGIGDGARRIG